MPYTQVDFLIIYIRWIFIRWEDSAFISLYVTPGCLLKECVANSGFLWAISMLPLFVHAGSYC